MSKLVYESAAFLIIDWY
jgi:hypothetical protein